MLQARAIVWSLGISLVMGVGWALSHAETMSGEGHSALGPVISTARISSDPNASGATARQESSATVPVENAAILRALPTVSKKILVGGTTLLPYIGAGFGGGYVTELDRSLNSASSISSNTINSSLKNLSQGLLPNEVQMGIRFPF
ncbi:MAG: hypothetical protein QM706_00580 [Nitrospira sp.]